MKGKEWLRENCIPVVAVCVLIIVIVSGALVSKSGSNAEDLERLRKTVADQDERLAASKIQMKNLELENANSISVIEGLKAEYSMASDADMAARQEIERLREELSAREKALEENRALQMSSGEEIQSLKIIIEEKEVTLASGVESGAAAEARINSLQSELESAQASYTVWQDTASANDMEIGRLKT
jgi:chromosome segregation ATPase